MMRSDVSIERAGESTSELPIFAQFEFDSALVPPLPFGDLDTDRARGCDAHIWNRAQLAEVYRLLQLAQGRGSGAGVAVGQQRLYKRIRTLSRCLSAAKGARLHDAMASELEALLRRAARGPLASSVAGRRLGDIKFLRLLRAERPRNPHSSAI
jgi:hypothetical protein